jgi:hypothetical protein
VKLAEVFGNPVEPANKVGEDAIKTVVRDVKLLVLAGGNEDFDSLSGKVRDGAQERAGAGIGKIEVEPQPAVRMLRQRPVDRKLLRSTPGPEQKRGDEPGQRRSWNMI